MALKLENNLGNKFNLTHSINAGEISLTSKDLASTKLVDSIAELKLISGSIADKLEVLGYYEKGDGGGGLFYWDSASTEADNGGTIIQATGITTGRWKRVFSGAVNVKWFGAVGDGVTDDTEAIQSAIDSINAGGTLVFLGLTLNCTSKISIGKKIKLVGGTFIWNHSDDNVFELIGSIKDVKFLDMKFIDGGLGARSSKGAIGCSSGVNTENLLVHNCTFDGVPFGVYINADNDGLHKNPIIRYCKFLNSPRFVNDSTSGSGLGLVFSYGGTGLIENGKSEGNYFYRNQRHGLYISDGGGVESINDVFREHRFSDGGSYIETLAAMQISRNALNVSVENPTFLYSKDVSIRINGVQRDSLQTFPTNIVVNNPKFYYGSKQEIIIGGDTPAINGHPKSVNIIEPLIVSDINGVYDRIDVLSGLDIFIKGVTVNKGLATYHNIIRVYGFGTISEFDRLTIDGVKGTAATGKGVRIDSNLATGTQVAILSNIVASPSPISYATTPTNPNIKEDIPILQEYPLSTISDPNGIVTARPGALFLSRSGGTGATLWVKETTFGSGGWVAK